MEEKKTNVNKETGIAIVSSLLNKKATETAELIKTGIIKGESNPTYVGVVLKKFEKIYEAVKKDKELFNLIAEDTKKYQEGTAKTFSVFGATITIANGRSFWDFKDTQDEYLNRLKTIEKEIKDLIKNREDELKLKAEAWSTKNTPQGGIDFQVKPFLVTWDELPKLEWEEGYGECETLPPVKRGGAEQLRYKV